MTILRAVIIDDEEDAVFSLRRLAETFCTAVEIAGTGTNAISGLKVIQELKPDLVFLDVEMAGGSGFDLLDAIPEKTFEVIFTTAYAQYAINALRNDAADYLLKPVAVDELRAAVERVRRKKENRKEGKPAGDDYKIKITDQQGTVYLRCEDVLLFEGNGRYSTVYTVNEKRYTVSKNLKAFEEELADCRFFRVHKSYLINCKHVVRITHADGGFLELSNGKQIEISRRKKAEFQEFMKR